MGMFFGGVKGLGGEAALPLWQMCMVMIGRGPGLCLGLFY